MEKKISSNTNLYKMEKKTYRKRGSLVAEFRLRLLKVTKMVEVLLIHEGFNSPVISST